MTAGTVTVRRPRVRGLEERFESRVLPLFVRRTEEVAELLPQLYLHGLAQGDFELALRGLLGEGAPLSPSSIERLRAKWTLEYKAWRTQRLDPRSTKPATDRRGKTGHRSRRRRDGVGAYCSPPSAASGGGARARRAPKPAWLCA
jgi:hypothetical protein